MKSLRIAVAAFGLLGAAFAGPVLAVPLPYNFHVSFNNGPLSGQTFFANLTTDSLDCPANVCTGFFTPGDLTHTLLSLNITVAGTAFTANADGGFPAFPRVGFDAAGRLNFIDYDGVVAGNELIMFGSLSVGNQPSTALAVYDPAVGLTSTGFAVPEPGTVPLLGGALLAALAFGWLRRGNPSLRLA